MVWTKQTPFENTNLRIKYCAQMWHEKAAFTRPSQNFDQPRKVQNRRKKKVILYDSKHQYGEVEGESHQNQGIMEIFHSKEQKEVAQKSQFT